ncbi:MAG: hypothetical protein H6606_06085 [Flavobacteriales bacterium]|nr:hypothetical protein [Flavobacteriales bacterium]
MALSKLYIGEDMPLLGKLKDAAGLPTNYADLIEVVAVVQVNEAEQAVFKKSDNSLKAGDATDEFVIPMTKALTSTFKPGKLSVRVEFTFTDAMYPGGRTEVYEQDVFDVRVK